MNTKVSIILPTYNRGYIISVAIRSVINQTYSDWELIIVDDGSTDDTENKILKFNDNRIKYIHYEKNRGGNYARNLGMKESDGEYIAFIDSDCEWHNDYLEKQLECFKNTNVDVVFARSLRIYSDEEKYIFPNYSKEELQTQDKIIEKALYESVFDTNVCMLKRKIYEQIGSFDEKLRRHQDWEYFLRLLTGRMCDFHFNDEILCEGYLQSDSISKKDELFWTARLYIFEKNIEFSRNLGINIELLNYLLTFWCIPEITPNEAEKLFSVLTNEEKADLCKRYYYNHSEEIERYNSLQGVIKYQDEALKDQEKLLKKNIFIMDLQKKWIECLIGGKSTQQYFTKHNIRSISIYGFGMLGKLLWNELKKSDIQVKQIIDANIQSDEVDICKLEDVCDFECDAVVVTAVAAFEEISQNIKEKTNIEIISIKDVIENL